MIQVKHTRNCCRVGAAMVERRHRVSQISQHSTSVYHRHRYPIAADADAVVMVIASLRHMLR